jgi:colanic acid biosynthesis protein WcaH
MYLPKEQFLSVIANTPLVSIDLIIRNPSGAILMGRRINEPAKDFWFVPGGRIYKNEDLEDAFKRICIDELGVVLTIAQARLFGVFTHKYQTNALGIAGVTTHYVVLAYDLGIPDLVFDIKAQHSQTQWITESEAYRLNSEVHENVLPYFKPYSSKFGSVDH